MVNIPIHQSRSVLAIVQRVIDVAVISGTLFACQYLADQHGDNPFLPIAAAVSSFLVIGEISGLYRAEHSRTANTEFALTLLSWLVACLALSSVAYFSTAIEYTRSIVFGWFLLAGAVLALSRMTVRILIETLAISGFAQRRCAIAGLNPLGIQLLENTQQNPGCGMQIVGFYDDRSQDRWLAAVERESQYRGRLDNLVEEAKAGLIDTVFVTLPMRAEGRIRRLLEQLSDTTASVYIVPDFFVFELLHSRWSTIGGIPAVSVFETPLYGVDGWLKRAFDLAAASIALLILSPVMLICAILVKLSSPGPIFFRQQRYGLDGREIWVWKFRSMRTCENGRNITQATKRDPRITAVGAILRRTSLDELPQLFNVLDGSMSLVGPRPHASAHNEHYRKLIRGYMLRHKVKPGITGLAQVEGYRGETETLEKMQTRIEFDHRYIQHWSLWLDLRILFKTLFVVLKQENAY
jgi:putative colanic acid biosynthesis UDP-glucose lipid carrier transferase